jgi:hypothetical protein
VGRISLTQNSFPQNCGKDFSYQKKAPKIRSRNFAGRISLTRKMPPKIPSRKIAGRISLTKKTPKIPQVLGPEG